MSPPVDPAIDALGRDLAAIVDVVTVRTGGLWAVSIVLRHKESPKGHMFIGPDKLDTIAGTIEELRADRGSIDLKANVGGVTFDGPTGRPN